jgi:putative membrane protein
MIDIVLLALAGVLGGVFTGLIPGIHPNMLAVMVLSASPIMLEMFTVEAVAVFIVAAAISHTFLSFIPSVFIGAPEADTALSVLPGHRLLLEGMGQEAVYLTVLGGVGVILLTAALFPLVCLVLPLVYTGVKGYIAYLLIFTAALMVFTEKGTGIVKGLLVLGLSGLLGVIVTGMPVLPSHTLLFPVFTGLFGISTLLVSLWSGVNVPEQVKKFSKVGRRVVLSGSLKGFVSGLVVGILPGVGAAQAAVMVHQMGRGGMKEFLISLGGINTVATLFSLMALYLIARPRSGVALAVAELVPAFGFKEMLLVLGAALFATGLAAVLALRLTSWFSGVIQKLDYKKLSWGIIIFLAVMVGGMTGLFGLFVLGVSTGVGLLAPLWGVKRSHLVGVLMIPVILYYLGAA